MTRFSKLAGSQQHRSEEASKWEELKPVDRDKTKPDQKVNFRKKEVKRSKQPNFRTGQIEDLYTELKKETRRENRRVKRQKTKQEEKVDNRVENNGPNVPFISKEVDDKETSKCMSDTQVCYNCREHGHSMSDCPKVVKDVEQGTGICFKCGSTEHTSSSCKVKVKPGVFPYAKCFICGETGHLSKQCPDNPKGLYPMGGCCKECGSVEHYVKNCPEAQSKQGIDSVTLPKMDNYCSADAEEDLVVKQPPSVKKKTPKLVKF